MLYRFFDGIWQTKESEEGVRFLLEEEGKVREFVNFDVSGMYLFRRCLFFSQVADVTFHPAQNLNVQCPPRGSRI